jgi:arsenate reductase
VVNLDLNNKFFGEKTMKVKVAFICVHNSCRSQMAEALGKLFAFDVFESYSAGTELRPEINQDAVRIIKDLYNVDMNERQKSKLLDDIPQVDIVVKVGCNVVCPFLPCKHEEDWGLEDPSGKSDEEFIKTARCIEEKVKDLAKRIKNKEIDLS